MVVGVNGFLELSGGEGGQHLVHVHVGAGARTCLVGVDGELVVIVAGNDLVSGPGNRVSDLLVQNTQFGIGQCR